MTKDDAIAILQGVARYLMSGNEILYSDKLMLALDVAIEALKEVKNQNEELNNSNESSLTQNALDTISRQKAIDALNSGRVEEDGIHFWRAERNKTINAAVEIIQALPSAQPEDCDTCKHGYFGDDQCERCRVRYPSHYERRTDGVDS